MIELRKCLKYEWAWCDGDCEHCRVVCTTNTVPPYIQDQFVRTGGSHEEEPISDVKHGRWEEKTVNTYRIDEWQSARCSVCGRYHTTPYMYSFTDFKYCPNCGKPMEEQ